MFIEIIWKAIERLHIEDSDLFEDRKVKEECINFRLSLYIMEEIQKSTTTDLFELKRKINDGTTKIDMEYDKSGDDIKRIYGNSSRPDILIHQRRSHENNFAYIEIKKGCRSQADITKCVGAKNQPFQYTYSLVIDNLAKQLPKVRVFEFLNDGTKHQHPNPY
ncbi:MAG TPA: hypothetical protein PLR90_06135 [Methylophilus sp.]|nr:hypothetical protein [Methylophilus sp.]HQQ33478.1 hypothetical protein [Methylophilus sp.]